MAEGILDLAEGERGPRSLAQRAMESKAVARFYERGARAPLVGLRGQARLDEESEHVLLRSMLAPEPALPIVDLACGTGIHAWRLAQHPGAGPVIGIDRSAPMLHEAAHRVSEAGAQVDLLRADAASLPLRDATVGAVLCVGALHLWSNAAIVLREVERILVPGGTFACATLLPERIELLDRIGDRAGVHRRGEDELRRLSQAAGLAGFERILLPPWIVFRVAKRA